jgi:CheY-like chemotaxis protein/DNA-directed RNA polymerase specialized sigma24 family protein
VAKLPANQPISQRGALFVTANAIAEHLPILRRYARALSGSQASGDAYVAATLEALVEDPSILEGQSSVRVALYKAFTKVWNSIGLNRLGGGGVSSAPDRYLSEIMPLPRQAFLLVALEGFDEGDAADILGVSVPELRALIDDSGRELAAEIATDVLIIEDEPMIAVDLEGLVEGLGHRVTGIARTHAEAVSRAKAKRPGLILADIRLADMSSGIDAVNELLQYFDVPVIFITAYPERYLTGERPEPTFLITKPYQPATVSAVISQALFFDRKATRKRPVEA